MIYLNPLRDEADFLLGFMKQMRNKNRKNKKSS